MAVSRLMLARHGESDGNVAAAAADARGDHVLGIDLRDADVPLTALGEEQAEVLGEGIAALPDPPTTVWSSPYLRAASTARIAIARSGWDLPLREEERLRDRELGSLVLLSAHGVAALRPAEAVLSQSCQS